MDDASLNGLSGVEREELFRMLPVEATRQAALFPQSVASGDPRVDGAVLWTRVEPTALTGTAPEGAMVGWQIASDEEFTGSSVLVAGVARLSAATDFTVKVAAANAVLQPFTHYYYRFLYRSVVSRVGRFKTLPPATAGLAELRLGFVVCQDYGNGYYNALTHLATEEVDYVVHLGDYIYETIADGVFQQNAVRTAPPFPSGKAVPQDVEDYRHLYKVYRSDVNQQAVHERFSYILLWDDHEFANDCHQDFHPDNNVAPDTATTGQPALRQAANRAWSEYGLADTPFRPDGEDWETSVRVYRTFSFGTLVELMVTDERLYRDGPPCGSDERGERYFSLGCGAMSDPARTMLGETQKEWFLDRLTTTGATWKLWANEVMLMQLKLALVYVNLDQWDGYQQERNAILNVVKHGKIKNFVALTGDLHTFLAGYLKTNFDNPFEPHVGVELMVGSITSANISEEIEADFPLPSRPVPAKQMNVPPALISDVVRVANPWIEFFDSSTHGYGILTLTPEELVCEFKVVSTIREPTATVSTLATFTVPVDEVKLRRS